MKITVVVPCYFEEGLVRHAYDRVRAELLRLGNDYEIIFVDDGSGDNTFAEIEGVAKNDLQVKGLKLSTNVGSHMAIRAGLSYATGECACFIACDMQEPPELIGQMAGMINDRDNIIWAVRNSRDDKWTTVMLSALFYRLARAIVTKNIPPSGASMFMISRRVYRTLEQYDERNLTLEGLFATMGFASKHIYYDRQKRIAGKSKWTLSKKVKLFIDFFVAYSNKPIRFVTIVGFIFSFFGFAWTIYVVILAVFIGNQPVGWPALTSVVLVGFGVTNISLGIIAEYLWRTLDESRKRPKFIVERAVNQDITEAV